MELTECVIDRLAGEMQGQKSRATAGSKRHTWVGRSRALAKTHPTESQKMWKMEKSSRS
jgi:hypothetical protein